MLASIEWFTPAYQAGGIVSSLVNQTQHLSEFIDFWVVCSDRDLLHPLPSNPALGQWLKKKGHQVMYVSPPFSWEEIINQIQPDVIYINGIFNGPFCRALLKKKVRKNIPTVLASHGMLAPNALSIKSWIKKPWLKLNKLLGDFDGITWHASNKVEAQQIRRHFERPIIRIAQNLPPGMPSHIHQLQPGLRFLSVGRIHPIKNYKFAAQCLASCAQSMSIDFTYQLIGPIEDKAEKSLIERYQNNNLKIEFLGEKSPSELGKYYQNAQCLLVPSLTENFGLVVTEALSNGLPVITSDQTPWGQYPASAVLQCLPLKKAVWISNIEQQIFKSNRHSHIEKAQDFFRKYVMSDDIIQQHIQLFS